MNKERLGNFIGGERRSLGLTQKDLAARLHVTDKAVSKWERGMSYPDVTLLEPLAAALDLTVEELMASSPSISASACLHRSTIRPASSESRCPARPGFAPLSSSARAIACTVQRGFGQLVAALSR